MYEDELKRLKSLGQLSPSYKEPSFLILRVIPNNSPSNSNSPPCPSMWSKSPIAISTSTPRGTVKNINLIMVTSQKSKCNHNRNRNRCHNRNHNHCLIISATTT